MLKGSTRGYRSRSRFVSDDMVLKADQGCWITLYDDRAD